MTKKIITSALPYVNNQPHLGNIIGCVLSGDIYTRFCKKNGEECVYICGTDEYGTAIEMTAFIQNKKPLEICEENRVIHEKIYNWFNIKFDYFGHTTTKEHIKNVQSFFNDIYKNGGFTEQTIEQHFCNKCELFLADRYIVGVCKFCNFEGAKGDQCDNCGHTYKTTDLICPKCAICGESPCIKNTNHLFFDFNLFREQLEDLYKKNSKYWSENGKKITKSWLNQELLQRCMTRDLKNLWGVPVPLDGYEKKVFYVWFDAVIGYFTFLKEHLQGNYEEWINDGELIQFMGKDNVFFHTIVFPSLIFGTKKKYPLLKQLSVTEFLLFENKKFSKSSNHGIFGLDLIDNSLGNSCLWRYYLTKIRPETCDTNFSFDHFTSVITSDLNNTIGNFCNRVLKFIKNKNNNKIYVTELIESDNNMIKKVNNQFLLYKTFFKDIKLKDALNCVLEISRIGNEYVQQVVSIKENMQRGFSIAFSIVKLLSQILEPFIPISAIKLQKMCQVKNERFCEEFSITMNWEISKKIEPLFSHLSPDIIERFNKFKI